MELKTVLTNLFQEDVKPEVVIKKNIQEFPDLFHFVEWYLSNENSFTDKQKIALKTLVDTKNLINIGCACKRQQRLMAAQNYFQIFWTNNLKTDLIATVLSISKCDKVQFGNFLQYP